MLWKIRYVGLIIVIQFNLIHTFNSYSAYSYCICIIYFLHTHHPEHAAPFFLTHQDPTDTGDGMRHEKDKVLIVGTLLLVSYIQCVYGTYWTAQSWR